MSEKNEKTEIHTTEPVREGPAGNDATAANPGLSKNRFPTVGDLLALLGIAFVSQVVVGILGRLFLLGTDPAAMDPNATGRMMAIFYFVSMSVTLAGVLYYRRARGGRGSWARFSLRGLNPTLLLWSFVLIFAVGIVLEPLLRVLPDLSLNIGRGSWTILSLVVFAPVFEELLCRGVVLGSLRDRYGVTVAWFGSALFFGILHIYPVQVVSATVVGLILGYVYLATDSLWSAMILHALNNAAAYLLMVMVATPENGHDSALLIDLVSSRTLYILIYACALALSAVSGWMMVRTLHRMKKAEKNPSRA